MVLLSIGMSNTTQEFSTFVPWSNADLERQIAGDPALEFDPTRGTVRAPRLAWGPYLWAEGITERSDGLQCPPPHPS